MNVTYFHKKKITDFVVLLKLWIESTIRSNN